MLRRSPPDGSYVYDTETQLYYLQSRYYNPEIGRFINADALVSTGQGNLGVTAIPVPDGPIDISAPHISGKKTDFLWHITVKPVRFWGIFADGHAPCKDCDAHPG